ncbi:tRNA lysidine(34) synthetase TilS [Rhodoferax sp.]|uniref:tRNA lysidine(34) synthetase TilS n=1 Tax=Rhodoferax sp. TaxID=50421 RepID=UPI0025FD2105|nr:tRNA lysidine(34) synthetase TilS [Rhodoferax sp.]
MTLSVPQAMAAFTPQLPLAVAYSGGADSTALLLACAQKWPGQIVAWHVHHGLQLAADDFVAHCQTICTALGIPLRVHKVDAGHQPGESPEDAARRARYQSFSALALKQKETQAIPSIAIAQHADDQIETLLLALSRGAGLPGLSAMPQHWHRDGLAYYRPFLQVSGADLRQWLAGQGVEYIEDPSNTDERYTRNRIRAQLMPALRRCFGQCQDTFARSARHAAQAQALLQEVAQRDLLIVGVPPKIVALQTLSAPRLANVLRYWLTSEHQIAPSAAQLDALMRQILACTTRGHQMHLKVANGFCVRRGDEVHWYNP